MDYMILPDGFIGLIATIIEFTILAWIIVRVVSFVPSLVASFVKKIKNKSIIYHEKKAMDTDLDKGTLEKSEFGLKSLINFWK